ncbi:MAG: hypothetical protein WCH98_01205 [Verrucomicrobiota bacterium]
MPCPFHSQPDPFGEARRKNGVLVNEFQGAPVPMILRHEDVRRAAKDWQTFSSDAPLVMPGGFGYALNRKAIPRPANPLLLAWPLNTYWQTNFRASQPGPVDLQWRFHVHGPWSPETATAAAQSSGPLYLHPAVSLPAILSGKL